MISYQNFFFTIFTWQWKPSFLHFLFFCFEAISFLSLFPSPFYGQFRSVIFCLYAFARNCVIRPEFSIRLFIYCLSSKSNCTSVTWPLFLIRNRHYNMGSPLYIMRSWVRIPSTSSTLLYSLILYYIRNWHFNIRYTLQGAAA